MPEQTTVHILLATYNGADHLAEQLDSIARQTHRAWTLTVSDDGSTDDTLSIVQRFASQVAQTVTVLQGPMKGSSTANFCHLVAQAPACNSKDLYAFCDQDDVWLEYKLKHAVQWHEENLRFDVRLYCGRTQFVNERLQPIQLSPDLKRPPSFGNALVQNIASGNTMVFSHTVLIAQQQVEPDHCVWHDWTTYIVSTALDGLVSFDDTPNLLYRQHTKNVLGSNDGLKALISCFKPLLEGRFKHWSEMNSSAVHDLENFVAQGPKEILIEFQNMRSSTWSLKKVLAFYKSAIRRQSFLSNAALAFGLVINIV